MSLAQSPFEIRRLTVQEFLAMVEARVLGEDEHVELLEYRVMRLVREGERLRVAETEVDAATLIRGR